MQLRPSSQIDCHQDHQKASEIRQQQSSELQTGHPEAATDNSEDEATHAYGPDPFELSSSPRNPR